MMFRRKNKKNYRSAGMEIEDCVLTATEKEVAKMEKPMEKKWLDFFWWVIIVFLVVLGGRIFYLNVVKGEYYREIARGNSVRSLSIKSPRGKIFDRSGKILVNNIPSIDAIIIPADLPRDKSEIKKMSEKLSNTLKINEGEVFIKLDGVNVSSLTPVLLKENISRDESLILSEQEKELPGIKIEKTAIRDYVDSLIFSHILGYEGKIEKDELKNNPEYLLTDYIGKQGIENSYEKYLRGEHGSLQVEVDSLGNVQREIGIIDSKPGSDLILSVDAQLQKKIFDSLTNVLEKTQTKTAAAVAIDPRNGDILALVSLPSFDNNLFARKISQEQYAKLINDADKPLFNRAISGEYPPGSTIKPLIAAAALSEGVISQSTTVNCAGAINIGQFRFGDWKTHGVTSVEKAIAESCDVFFYSVGGGWNGISGMGMNLMKKYENLFGLGAETGIDIPGESDGFIPDEEWKLEKFGEKWYIGNSYHAAIGQGFITTTPLQVANYVAAIANGGSLYQPKIVSKIKKNNSEILSVPSKCVRKDFISSEVIKIVQGGMRQTVVSGTAQSLNDLPVEVAGKTGTAQFGSEDKTHAWFVSYAPYNNPEIAMIVLVEGGGEGHSSAVPVTKEVYQWYFSRDSGG